MRYMAFKFCVSNISKITNNNIGSGKIQVLPHSEGADSIVVKAKNPNDHDKEFGSFNVNANYYYDTLSLSYSVQSDVASQNPLVPAYWSKFQNDAIVLGDGEQLTFMFSVAQKKLKDLKISANLRSRNNPAISLTACAAEGQFILSHSTDITQPAYKIITGYAPTYKGSRSYPDGTPISIYDFYRSGWEDCNWYLDWFVSHYDRWGAEVWNNGPTSTRVYEFYSGSLHERYPQIKFTFTL